MAPAMCPKRGQVSISSIMPVIFPARPGCILEIAGNSFSPIICFCTSELHAQEHAFIFDCTARASSMHERFVYISLYKLTLLEALQVLNQKTAKP